MTNPSKAPSVDPDMPADQLRLHFGELTPDEVCLVRAAIRFANTRAVPVQSGDKKRVFEIKGGDTYINWDVLRPCDIVQVPAFQPDELLIQARSALAWSRVRIDYRELDKETFGSMNITPVDEAITRIDAALAKREG